ncbi:MAG: FAD-dependent oxidoreductase [Pirellulales bacterium]|nr:FAD-dependent oxidoreductase [Pirellulales bacterium]
MNPSPPLSLAIVGGGLAGMAAALAARTAGWDVTLFEKNRFLGGRVYSIEEDWNGQILDAVPHVALGCCTRFLDFCRRLDLDAELSRQRTLYFLESSGRARRLSAAPLLPAPWHLLPSLLRMKSLSFSELRRLAQTLKKISPLPLGEGSGVRAESPLKNPHPNPLPKGEGTIDFIKGGQARFSETENESLGDWLRWQGASDQSLQAFWSLVVQSALSETVDFVSLPAAGKLIRECFFASRRGYEMMLPRRCWRELLDGRAGGRLADLGVTLRRGARVMWIEADPDAEAPLSVVLADGAARSFDAVILAVPWHQVAPLLSGDLSAQMPQLDALASLQPGSIAAVHLWFDRPITPLPHALLQSQLAPWLFAAPMHFPDGPPTVGGDSRRRSEKEKNPVGDRSRLLQSENAAENAAAVHYYQTVISAAHRVAPSEPEKLREAVLDELRQFCPPARGARLLHAREVVHPRAIFSPEPGSDRFRPPQKTPVPRLLLAGDWTATGWPATMESAVRSGFLAVEELVKEIS